MKPVQDATPGGYPVSRRTFLIAGVVAGAAALVPLSWGARRVYAEPIPGGTLDSSTITKYAQPLAIPPAMPQTNKRIGKMGQNVDYYEIAVRQFEQQILPAPLPKTTVWGYGSVNHAGSFSYPSFTIEARYNRPVRVKWINGLVDSNGNYLPHLLPVDPTLHWANPAGGTAGRDMRPSFTSTPGPYTGPVPLVTHIHGAHSDQESDGYPTAWFLPAANNIPEGYATTGTYYDTFKESSPLGAHWSPGSAVFQYPNDQRPSTMWFHDHTLGMTRLNVYAGPSGFYIVRGGPHEKVRGPKAKPAVLPGPAPALGDPAGTKYYEIPIAIQDRSFNADGSLFFPDSRTFFDEFEGPYTGDGDSDIAPIWNPEFFGNTMVVNGRAWPYLNVEQRRYRFRFLNGCNSRFLILKLSNGQPFWQIGTEGGFLPAPVQLDQLLMGLAERADVIVDFTDVPVGTTLTLLNIGPDEPFGGGEFEPADPATTGQVMQFRVVARTSKDPSTPPSQLVLPALPRLDAASITRKVSLNEMMSMVLDAQGHPITDADGDEEAGPAMAMLGTLNPDGTGKPLGWMDPVSESPAVGATEIWEIYNFTADAHPIHVHLVQFQVVDRQALMTDEEGVALQPAVPIAGSNRAPEVWETGFKDTVIAYPGEITRIKATFDKAGQYVWHCHIVDHEDNEMMRPFTVG